MNAPCIAMAVVALLAGTAPREKPRVSAWYTQIGFWHLNKDTVSGRSYISHNASVDAAASGQATANLRFNKGFDSLTRFEARLALGPAPASAGLLVQNKPATYCFFIKKEKTGNFLQICRREKTESAAIFIAPVSVTDTVTLQLSVKKNSLDISAGKTIASIARPSDFSGTQWIGFECVRGRVSVFAASVASKDGEMRETFKNATLVNLHLEKMFPAAK